MAIDQEERLANDGSVSDAVAAQLHGQSGVARKMTPLINKLFEGGLPVRFVFWDQSTIGPEDGPGEVILRSRAALTRLIWSPDELGIVRGYVTGEIDMEGHFFSILSALHHATERVGRLGLSAFASGVKAALQLGAIRRPPPRPAEEVRLSGLRHSKVRDAEAISHHYDVGNEFYRLVLGPSMTYSCAYFTNSEPRHEPLPMRDTMTLI